MHIDTRWILPSGTEDAIDHALINYRDSFLGPSMSARLLSAIGHLETDPSFPHLAEADILKARLYQEINKRLPRIETAVSDDTIRMAVSLLSFEVG